MARKNQQNLDSLPEVKHAARLIRDHNLEPPVDIFGLASKYAEIEQDNLPTDADAYLLYNDAKRRRPLIVLQRDRPLVRKRFTLAHELGHIVIPWHCGELAYSAKQHLSFREMDEHSAIESEANRFASELLMPSDWVKSAISEGSTLQDVHSRILRAEVSDHAAVWRMFNYLACCIIAQLDESGCVIKAQKSRILPPKAKTPLKGTSPALSHFGLLAETWTLPCSDSRFLLWKFPTALPLGKPPLDASGTIIVRILDDIGVVGGRQSKCYQSINGKIGHLHGTMAGASPEQLFAFFQQRFCLEQSEWAEHPDFSHFLKARALELGKNKPDLHIG